LQQIYLHACVVFVNPGGSVFVVFCVVRLGTGGHGLGAAVVNAFIGGQVVESRGTLTGTINLKI
jgi:hypothetical protein